MTKYSRLGWLLAGVWVGCASSDESPTEATAYAVGAGLRAEYFANETLSGTPAFTRADAPLQFDWGSRAPAAGFPADHFSVRWQGQLVPTKTVKHVFRVKADDRVKLWVSDQLVLDASPYGGLDSKSVSLTAGQAVPIRMEYVEQTGNAYVSLAWKVGSSAAVAIPATALTSGASDSGSPPPVVPPPVVPPPANPSAPPEGPANVNVDFGKTLATIDPVAIGIDETSYGGTNRTLASDTTEQGEIRRLATRSIRVELKYSGGNVVSGAAGSNENGDALVSGIKSAGGEPMVIVPMNPTDAANLVRRYPDVKLWVVGNEPDNHGVSAAGYSSTFNAVYDAMKNANTSIKVGGPATAWFNESFIDTFLSACGSRVDFVDFHHYGEGQSDPRSPATLLAETKVYEENLNTLRSKIRSVVPDRASRIGVQVGEWNLTWWNGDGSRDSKVYGQINGVWGASVLGHILRAGGWSKPYGTKNGGLGVLFQDTNSYGTADTPMPLYHAIGMFTGEGLFRRFDGSVVAATTALPDVEVYAATSGTLVVVNKSPSATQKATFALGGKSAGAVDVWRKDTSQSATSAPASRGSIAVTASTFADDLPPYSVTTYVLR